MNAKLAKLIVAGIASAYFLWCAYDPYQWHLIDGVNLVIHEAGHIVFYAFGEFMMIAGGSLFQVIMPLLFAGYFAYNRKFYSASLVLFWVGESILNVSVYAWRLTSPPAFLHKRAASGKPQDMAKPILT